MPPAIIGAAITAAAGIGSSLLAGHAAKKAANAQSDAAAAGITEERRQFDLTRSDLMPWLTAGKSALGGELDLLGLSGADKQQSAITALQNGPLFGSLYRQGTEAILQNASATGGLRGGNTEHSLANFGSDLLAQVIQQQMANLGGISGAGAQVGSNLGQFGQNKSAAIAGLLGQQGAAKAGGVLGSAQGIAGALNGVAGFLTGSGILGGGGGGIPTGNLGDFSVAIGGF